MTYYDRRAFLGLTAGALSVLHNPLTALAETCVTSGLPEFLPARLTVDCASRKNYNIFRANSGYMGLAGAVNMTWVEGKYGRYEAGNLFLFPWLKDKGRAFGPNKVWGSGIPSSDTQTMAISPINKWLLPLDGHFWRYCIQAPWRFIGFGSILRSASTTRNSPGLPTASSPTAHLGHRLEQQQPHGPWFGGSRWFPIPPSARAAAGVR